MARKIFLTYKYGDANVYPLPDVLWTKCRDYVDDLQKRLDKEDHINKGELDGQSLADFEDETIASKLRDKIFDSSLTIVLISKGMKSPWDSENNQWIPWEIAYSLKEHTRDSRTSLTNAMLAIAIPDQQNSYSYIIQDNSCSSCNCTTYHTNTLFKILQKNTFNRKNPVRNECANHPVEDRPQTGEFSYIPIIKWNDFISDINSYLDRVYKINEGISAYNIYKTVV
jgi:hypothetical protein